jgi:serine phosphatase RsbU (regulator of sigma subunit)
VAELSSALRRLMRKHIDKLDQTRFVRALNREFSQAATVGKFATALLTTYFTLTHHLIVCNAGHPQPLLYRAATGKWQPLVHDMEDVIDRVSNLPLGIIDPTDYHQFAVELEMGDLVLIYTDALIEAKSPSSEELGLDGLLEVVSKLDTNNLTNLCPMIIESVCRWRGGVDPDDDETIILLHHNGAGPPKQSIGERLGVVAKMLGLKKV